MDDGHDDAGDSIDDSHDASTDGLETRDDSTHICGVVIVDRFRYVGMMLVRLVCSTKDLGLIGFVDVDAGIDSS